MLLISRIQKLGVCLIILFVYVIVDGIDAVENSIIDGNRTRYQLLEENYELLKSLLQLNNVFYGASGEKESIPTDALNGVYTECVAEMSFPCLQKKLIAFLYKLDKVKSISLVGKTVVLVRKGGESGSDAVTLAKIAEHVDQSHLKDVIDNLVDKFFDNHSLRLKVPEYFEDYGSHGGEGTFLDIDFGSAESSNSPRESRKKKGDGKYKGMKKVMMMIGLMTCVKLTMMGPLMVGLLGLKAMKALILAVMSLTISKMMMLSKVNVHSLFHGNDWYSSGGGGWDRNIQETPITSTLPYNMEPPAAYGPSYAARTVK